MQHINHLCVEEVWEGIQGLRQERHAGNACVCVTLTNWRRCSSLLVMNLRVLMVQVLSDMVAAAPLHT